MLITYVLLCISIILSLICLYGVFKIYAQLQTGAIHVPEPIAEEHDEVADELSIDDEERIRKRREFTDRIERIKSELALQQTPKHTGTPAMELHPGVTNLPHNTIAEEHSRIPDIEYAE